MFVHGESASDYKNSATVCSVSRFIVIVDNRATTYPAFDPTWYGGTGIVLSVLEVNIATIVAALPVFWPLLRRNIDRIFITHEVEVKVTSTEGFNQIKGDGDSDVKRQPTHWPNDGNEASANNVFEVVVLKDLKTANDNNNNNNNRSRPSGEDTFDTGMPFDGRRSNSRATSHQHNRLNSSHSVSSQSKEILLRRS